MTKRGKLVPNPYFNEQIERRERQRELMYGYRLPATPQFIWADSKPEATREGARLLSKDQIKKAQAEYKQELDEKPQPLWCRSQEASAKHLTVEFLKLNEGSWQTVEDQVVKPVLERRGLKRKKK